VRVRLTDYMQYSVMNQQRCQRDALLGLDRCTARRIAVVCVCLVNLQGSIRKSFIEDSGRNEQSEFARTRNGQTLADMTGVQCVTVPTAVIFDLFAQNLARPSPCRTRMCASPLPLQPGHAPAQTHSSDRSGGVTLNKVTAGRCAGGVHAATASVALVSAGNL
jgi:hypothetical protein